MATPLSITTQPTNQSAVAGQSATFKVVVNDGIPPYFCQWQKNGVDIAGATSASYTTPALVIGDNGGKYKCIIKDSGTPTPETVTSGEAILMVTATAPTQPAVQPPRRLRNVVLWVMGGIIALMTIALFGALASKSPAPTADVPATVAAALAETQAAEPTKAPTLAPTNTKVATATNAPATATEVGAPATATKIATAINTAAPTLAPTNAPTQAAAYNLAADFQQFLDNRGAEMATTVNDGDTPVAYEETAKGKAGFAVFGAPASVDPGVILQAKGADAYGNVFTNKIGLGTEMMFAEPGSILYGPDEPADIVNNNPYGAYISPITQALLEGDTANLNVQEGGFIFCTGREMTVTVDGVGIRLDGEDGHNWALAIRGKFEDRLQDSDLNRTLVFKDFVAGHTQCMMYPPGAFVSEEQFLQIAYLSHTGATNCGKEGCSGFSALMLDLNTQSWAVVYQEQTNAPWVTIGSNWRN